MTKILTKSQDLNNHSPLLDKETQGIHHHILFQIKGFVETRFLGKKNPHYEKYLLLNKVRQELNRTDLKKSYLEKNGVLSSQFGMFLASLYKYAKPLKEKVYWGALFKTDQFPLFLVNQFSDSRQQEIYQLLTSEKQLRYLVENQGTKETKSMIKQMFEEYKNSFTDKQTFQVNQILSLGAEFYTFLSFDFHKILELFFPGFSSENFYSFKDPNNVNIQLHLPTIIDFLNHTSAINPDGDYFEFLNYYGKFFTYKIISEQDFNFFLNKLQPLIKSNFLMNLVKVSTNDALFRVALPEKIYQKPEISKVFKTVSEKIQEHHTIVTFQLKLQKQNSLLEGIFNSFTIQEIDNKQLALDQQIYPASSHKTYTSLLVVFAYFQQFFFESEILEIVQLILRKTIFNKEEVKLELINAFKKTKKVFFYTDSTLKTLAELSRKIIDSETIIKLEKSALTISQNFVKILEEFLNCLHIINQNALEDLSDEKNLIISQEELELMIAKIKTVYNLLKNLQLYIKIGLSLIKEG